MDPYSYPPSGSLSSAASSSSAGSHQHQHQHQHPDNPFLPPTAALAAAIASRAPSGGGASGSPGSDKARLGELGFLKTTLHDEGFFLPADWEESVLGAILAGLRCVVGNRLVG